MNSSPHMLQLEESARFSILVPNSGAELRHMSRSCVLMRCLSQHRKLAAMLAALFLYLGAYTYFRSTHLLIRYSNVAHPVGWKRVPGSRISYCWECYYNSQQGPWREDDATFPKAPWMIRAARIIYYPLMEIESAVWNLWQRPLCDAYPDTGSQAFRFRRYNSLEPRSCLSVHSKSYSLSIRCAVQAPSRELIVVGENTQSNTWRSCSPRSSHHGPSLNRPA
jgi:hypothetical protein